MEILGVVVCGWWAYPWVEAEDEVQRPKELVCDVLLVGQQPLAHPEQAEDGPLHQRRGREGGAADDGLQVRVDAGPEELDAVAVADGDADQKLQTHLGRGVVILNILRQCESRHRP
eukprot:scaffold86794_cov46-Prasinocladus_malaysianus.AAC.1